jgi:hypothetical protein
MGCGIEIYQLGNILRLPGWITGICEAAAARSLPLTDDYTRYPDVVAEALNRLRMASVDGPYAIALGPRCYTGLTQTRDAGYPVIEHVCRLLYNDVRHAGTACTGKSSPGLRRPARVSVCRSARDLPRKTQPEKTRNAGKQGGKQNGCLGRNEGFGI